MAVRAWHILMGHPVPDRKDEKSFRRKLAKLVTAVGREHLAALGYKKPAEFIEALHSQVYPPESSPPATQS